MFNVLHQFLMRVVVRKCANPAVLRQNIKCTLHKDLGFPILTKAMDLVHVGRFF